MTELLKLIEHRIVKPRLRRLKRWRYVGYGNIRVRYKDHLDGGGRTSGLDYLPLFRDLGMPRQARVFEWCAGPAFIGFALLGYGFCDSLAVADVNPEAVDACRRTVEDNGLGGRVAVYHADNLDGIPAAERWDLVVAIRRILPTPRQGSFAITIRSGVCTGSFLQASTASSSRAA